MKAFALNLSCILFLFASCASLPKFLRNEEPAVTPVVAAPDQALEDAREAEARAADEYQKTQQQVKQGKIEKLCKEMDELYVRNKWDRKSPCRDFSFEVFGESVEGRPLLWLERGDPTSQKSTLVQCAIHGDELPSIAMCFFLLKEIDTGKRAVPKGVRLIVQPLVNPDGMLKALPTRPNARGVDINRNFPTQDWDKEAHKVWRARDRGDLRKFPGPYSGSEPETQAIVSFLESHKTQKIISIHTPLGHLDLDAAGDSTQKRRAQYLAINMSKNSASLPFRSWGFFPGSLGNYAGRERQIPVYTLELPPGGSRATIDGYWKRFRVALWRAIDFDLDTGQFIED